MDVLMFQLGMTLQMVKSDSTSVNFNGILEYECCSFVIIPTIDKVNLRIQHRDHAYSN